MKTKHAKLTIFEGRKIRRTWDEKQEKWYFSVIDIIQALIQQPDYLSSRKYWNKLKERLKKEGNESVTKCHQLKLEASGGGIAKNARLELEQKTGKRVVSKENYKLFDEKKYKKLK